MLETSSIGSDWGMTKRRACSAVWDGQVLARAQSVQDTSSTVTNTFETAFGDAGETR